MMLKAKVQLAKELKQDFQKILDINSDSFSKQMAVELRKLVQKSSKDHNLDLVQEQKIVDNLAKSEEWFVSTFDKLQKLVGRALHTVDFKDCIQLSPLVLNERDIDGLLKFNKPENLVGAALNLWKSLNGCKWLKSYEKIMKSDSRDFQKILTLSQHPFCEEI